MTSATRRQQVLDALPRDGGYAMFAKVAENAGGGDDVYAVLCELRDDGTAELAPGHGWRRTDMGPAPTHEDPRDGYMAVVAETVERCGHMVQYVMGARDKRVAPFAYTVGLLGRLGCELVVTGALEPSLLQSLLNSAAELDPFPTERGVPQGKIMQPPYMAVLLDTTAYRCADGGYPLNIARAWDHHTGALESQIGDFPVVQLTWPDSGYRYPWQEHFDYHGDELGGQPLLAEPPARH